MGNNNFVIKYGITVDNGIPRSVQIDEVIEAYGNEFHVKNKDNNSPHIKSFNPNPEAVQQQLEYFNCMQSDMLSAVFDKLESLELYKKAYDNYFLNLKEMVSESVANSNDPAYFVYQHTAQALNKHQSWLEGYIDNELKPLKTIKDENVLKSLALHRDMHDRLAVSSMDLRNESAAGIKRIIGKGIDLADLAFTEDRRLTHADVHLVVSDILSTLTKNETISEKKYIDIRTYLPTDAVPEERKYNESIISIAKSMITIEPGFPKMKVLIASALKNHVDESLTVFMSAITSRIQSVSDDINRNNLKITKMVLILNVYLQIFRDIVPKLPLASSKGVIRYCGINYRAVDIFSSTELDPSAPAELQKINREYAHALLSLKQATERFISKLVSETNALIEAYEEQPSQDLGDKIMERIVGHKQCLSNYRLLFKDAKPEGLSDFELDKAIIPCSYTLLKTYLEKIRGQASTEVSAYRVMNKMAALELQIDRFAYLKNAHAKFVYDDRISIILNATQEEIYQQSHKVFQHAKNQLSLVKPILFTITLKNVLFLNDTFNKLLEDKLQINRHSNAQIIQQMIMLILSNPQYKSSRVIYDDVAELITENVPPSEQEFLKNLLPCPDFSEAMNPTPEMAQTLFAFILGSDFKIEEKFSQTQLQKLINICSASPNALTQEQYAVLIPGISEMYPGNKMIALAPMLTAFLTSYDILDQYSNIKYLSQCYQTILCCMDTDEQGTLDVLAKSESFIKHYPIHVIVPLLQKYPHTNLEHFINIVTNLHEKLVNHVLSSPKPPVKAADFMNHMLILMNNPSIHIDDPLKANAPTLLQSKSKELNMFINYVCHFITHFHQRDDFVEKLSSYIDHMVSYGLSLSPEQSVQLLSQILLLDAVPFKRVQALTIRIIHILPEISEQSPLSTQVEKLFSTAAKHRANALAEAMLDTDKICALLNQSTVDTYQPDIESTLSPGASAILNHFSKKLRYDKLEQPSKSELRSKDIMKRLKQHSADVIDRLHKQMKKLDRVILMIDQISKTSGQAATKALFDDASRDIARLEDPVKAYFGTQQRLDSSLCKCIELFETEAWVEENAKLLKTQLLAQYDRLMCMMLDRFITDLENGKLDIAQQITHLTVVYQFMDHRQNFQCKTLEAAAAMLTDPIHRVQGMTGRFQQSSDCEIFLRKITPACIMYKEDYEQHMIVISDKVVELGGNRLVPSQSVTRSTSAVSTQHIANFDLIL